MRPDDFKNFRVIIIPPAQFVSCHDLGVHQRPLDRGIGQSLEAEILSLRPFDFAGFDKNEVFNANAKFTSLDRKSVV